MVWRCVSIHVVARLHIWKDTINASKFIQVLKLPFRCVFPGKALHFSQMKINHIIHFYVHTKSDFQLTLANQRKSWVMEVEQYWISTSGI